MYPKYLIGSNLKKKRFENYTQLRINKLFNHEKKFEEKFKLI